MKPRLSSDRLRRIGTSAISSVAARIVTVLASFIAVPISLQYLGEEAFGLWATITSFVAMMAFADMGVGSGVMNAIATSYGKDDQTGIRKAAVNGFLVLSVISVCGLAIFIALYPFLSWGKLLGLTSSTLSENAGSAMLVLSILFAISIPTGVIQRLQFGIQQGHLNGIAQAASGIVSLALILLVSEFDLGLSGMVGTFLLAPMLATWFSFVYMQHKNQYLRPHRKDIDTAQMRTFITTGLQFFFIQLAWALSFATDNIIISHTVGVDAVTSYTVHQKLFSPVQIIASFAMTPLWAAYAEAISRRDIIWIKRVLSTGTIACLLLGSAVAAVLFYLAGPLMNLWLHGKVPVNDALSIAFSIWIVIDITGKSIAMFLNGVGEVKSQIVIAILFVSLSVPLKIVFAYWFGTPGVPFALALSYTITHIPSYLIIVRRWFKEHP